MDFGHYRNQCGFRKLFLTAVKRVYERMERCDEYTFENVDKRSGRRLFLRIFVASAQRVFNGLMGPSGCGKTTL